MSNLYLSATIVFWIFTIHCGNSFLLFQQGASYRFAGGTLCCKTPPTTTTTTTATRTTTTTTTTSSSQLSVVVTAVGPEDSQLAQLASMTILSIDSGDLDVIREFAATGYITDATTNPLFVSQAGISNKDKPVYTAMVDDAVAYAVQQTSSSKAKNEQQEIVSLAMDRLAVNLGKAISDLVPGYISTEVDPRLSFDKDASVERARRIIAMYASLGVPKDRVLIKLAATWEGIMAANELEEHDGIQCNLTLIFSVVQAIACAQYGAHLISPFPGRILDWHKTKQGRVGGIDPELDEGVLACREMYQYFQCHNHNTICMPASWRPSRGPGYDLDEIRALAGTDRMTIPAPLLQQLASSIDPLPRQLTPEGAKATNRPLMGNGKMTESEFRYRMNRDVCGTEKLTEGLNAFIGETEKLESAITAKVRAFVTASAM